MRSLVLHIPHASTLIPDEYRPLFLQDEDALRTELLRMTDRYTDELFACDAPKAVAPVSRLLCDPERFRDDAQEEMAARGMGVCYTKTSDGQMLKTITEAHRKEILFRYYDPHHKRLTELVQDTLRRVGYCTLVDCHSFASVPLPYEPEQSPERPDICLGTSSYHTPKALTDLCRDYFQALGLSVQENTPYAGVLVPERYYLKEPGVHAIMIEVNRSLYMDEGDGVKLASFTKLQEQIAGLLHLIDSEL